MSKNLAIIDSDSIAYLGNSTDSLQKIIDKVDYKISEILVETQADYYILLVSKGKYFRHEISKSKEAPEGSYKANRTYTAQPWVKTIKEYLIVQYGAVWYPQLEADDAAVWLMENKIFYLNKDTEIDQKFFMEPLPKSPLFNKEDFEECTVTLVAKDKDLLYSIATG
jgi:hypothetical protein